MLNLLRELWSDDDGAVVSVELLLIVTVLIFGLIPGYVALRNSVNATLVSLGNLIQAVVPSITFSGFEIRGQDGNGNNVVIFRIDGFSFSPDRQFLTVDQTDPILLPPEITVPPAP